MKKIFLFLLSFFSFLNLVQIHANEEDSLHVIFIGIDGLGGTYLKSELESLPNFKRWTKESSYTFEMQNVMHSSSPNWMSMIAGSGPFQHGVYSNAWQIGDSRPTPTIFWQLKNERPDAKVAIFHHWKDFLRLVEPTSYTLASHVDDSESTLNNALNFLKNEKPQFLFMHLDLVDSAGHDYGWGSDTYKAAMKRVDEMLLQIETAVKEAGLENKVLFVLSADHGGMGNHHGFDNLITRSIPFFIKGPGIVPGRKIIQATRIWDITSTLAMALKLKQNPEWISSPIEEVFGDHLVHEYPAPQLIKVHGSEVQRVFSEENYLNFSEIKSSSPCDMGSLGDVVGEVGTLVDIHSPLVKKAHAFEWIMERENPKGEKFQFWRPVAKRGFTCLGDVVTKGERIDPILQGKEIYCLSDHLVKLSTGQKIITIDDNSERKGFSYWQEKSGGGLFRLIMDPVESGFPLFFK